MPALTKRDVDGRLVEYLIAHVVDRDRRRFAWQAGQEERVLVAEGEAAEAGDAVKAARLAFAQGRHRLASGEMSGSEIRVLRDALAEAEDARKAALIRASDLRVAGPPPAVAQLIPDALDGLLRARELGVETPAGQGLAHMVLRRVYQRFTAYVEEVDPEPSPPSTAVLDPTVASLRADQIGWLLGDRHEASSSPRDAASGWRVPGTSPERAAPRSGDVSVYLLPELQPDIEALGVSALSVPLRVTAATHSHAAPGTGPH